MIAALLLLRHGQTDASASGEYCSTTDVPLNAVGRSQAMAWASPLRQLAPVASYVSPLRRAQQTASHSGLPAVALPELREWDLGELEGKSAELTRVEHPDWVLFRDGPLGERGEGVDQVLARAARALRVVSPAEGLVVCFTHGQMIRVLSMVATELPLWAGARFAIGPGRGVLLIRRSVGWVLAGWNLGPSDLSEGLRTYT